jgi:hypothetical protein
LGAKAVDTLWTRASEGRADAPARRCDICTAVIPRGTPYRIGHTTPDAVEDAFVDAEPAARVTHTLTPGGLVRIEVCRTCAALFTEAVLPDEVVDALH